MAVVVSTNMTSLFVQKNLYQATSSLQKSMQRLSTGLRINTAADDAAGLSLSEKLKTNINSSDVIKNNALTGINMLQTAEGDLSVIQDNLQRMRDLAIQSANGVYSSAERKMLDTEFQSRIAEINRIGASSKFSDLNLLDGSLTAAVLQIGSDTDLTANTIDITSAFTRVQASTIGHSGSNYLSNASLTTATSSRTAIDILDQALTDISGKRSSYGATVNRLNATVTRIDIRKENLTAAHSVIRDTDIAAETANLNKQQVLQQSSGILLKQANMSTQMALSLMQ